MEGRPAIWFGMQRYFCKIEQSASGFQWIVLEASPDGDLKRLATFKSERNAADTAAFLNAESCRLAA